LSLALIAIATAGSAWGLGLDGHELLGLLALLLPALALALGLGLWAGITFCDPAWTNPRAMLSPPGRIVSTLLLIAQAVAWIAVSAHVTGVEAERWATIAFAAVVAVAAAAMAFADGSRRLGRLEAAGT